MKLVPCLLVIVALTSFAWAADRAPRRLPAGVIAVSPTSEGIEGKIVVTVRDLDGWIIKEMNAHRILGEKHFDAEHYRIWIGMLPSPTKVDDWGAWQDGEWKRLEDEREGLQNTKKALDKSKDSTDEDRRVRSDYEKKSFKWNQQWQAMQSYEALEREVRENLYLILGNSRLKHNKAQYNKADKKADTKTAGEITNPTGRTVDNLTFTLTNDPADEEEWSKLIHGAQRRMPVQIRIGVDFEAAQHTIDLAEGELSSATPASDGFISGLFSRLTGKKPPKVGTTASFDFVTYNAWALVAGLGLVFVAFAVFLRLAAKTDLLRDPDAPLRPPEPDDPDVPGRHPFNLARCQMAFWFFLFTAAYVFLWAVKRQTDTLTDQCLVLLGISTGTMLGSALIGRSYRATKPMVADRLYSGSACARSVQRFFYELLSDGQKLTFYRFQMLVWTLVLGMVFIKSVWTFLQMPNFGENELALMGISAGSYLAFKFPEAKSQAQAAQA